MITIHDLYNGQSHDLQDDNAAWDWVHQHAPWALTPVSADIDDVLTRIDMAQHYAVERTTNGPSPAEPLVVSDVDGLFRAVEFLRDRLQAPAARSARILYEGDDDAAALAAAGLHITDQNRAALQGLKTAAGLNKSEQQPEVTGFRSKSVVSASTKDGMEVADHVRRAIANGRYHAIKLGDKSKHSKGTVLVRDLDDHCDLLLKPGSGPQSPAAGAREEGASQSQREAGFWHALDRVGLAQWAPRCDLLHIDGQEFAAIHWLSPDEYDTLHDLQEKDIGRLRAKLLPALHDGTLHRLAAIDYVFGNPDRHGRNVLCDSSNPARFFLIDHGSAFAGEGFDPAHDQNSFCPAYLRVFGPQNDFARLEPHLRLAALPRCSTAAAGALAAWLKGIDRMGLAAALGHYGIDHAPTIGRLEALTALASNGQGDEAVNRAWADGLVPPAVQPA